MHDILRARLRHLLMLSALLFAFSESHAATSMPPPETMPCRFSVREMSDTVIEITTIAPGGTGYAWFAETTRDITRLSDGVRAGDVDEQRAGQPVIQWWRFDVSSAWVQRPVIDFFLYRQWEGKKSAVRHCVVDTASTSSSTH